jgi:hypothetical protein
VAKGVGGACSQAAEVVLIRHPKQSVFQELKGFKFHQRILIKNTGVHFLKQIPDLF